jgi:hypothetical protein
LRCKILDVLIGNPLFTKEEQLLTNHRVHECEDRQRLLQWLENAHQEVKSRERMAVDAAREAARTLYCETNEQANELQRLTNCRTLNPAERQFAKMALPTCQTAAGCLTMVGRIYVELLHRIGKLDESYGYAE